MAIPNYKLSAVLHGHSMDVRCVAKSPEYCILSASRDRTAKLWHPEGVKEYVNVVTYKGHQNFVSCVCWLPPCETYPDGLVITGSNDNTIIGYNLQDGNEQINLKGHENAVCHVSSGCDSGILLSSSWDSTAKVWNLNAATKSPVTLQGHQAAVWAVVELGSGNYATASADKTIMIWSKQGALLQTLVGHTDCVRDLAVANADSFLSVSNDATVRLWSNKGQCLNTYYGHTNYIYSISMDPSSPDGGVFATGGEDGALRVWRGADCVLALALPAHSVWSVLCLDNGDIVTGSSDSVVRVFTKDPARYADEQTLKLFDEEVEKMQAANKQEIGGFKLSELPGPEALLEPGRTNGQTKMVRRGTNVKCYSWDAAGQSWLEVGDVMGANPATEGKTMYQGKEYDFVFSVDIKDGEPPLKLPFNITEDPWVAAQTFIHKNDLPQVYLEQVANFIISNAKLDKLPTAPSNGPADPFTGGARYVPGAEQAVLGAKSGGADPLTGGGAYTSSHAGDKPLIPHDQYIRFDQANLKAIHDKLKEFNSKIGAGLSALPDAQLESVVKLAELNCTYTLETVNLLKKLLQWPKEVLFPALDVARLAVRNKEINSLMFDSSHGPQFVEFLISLLAPDSLSANKLVSLRVLVNAFSDLAGEVLVLAAAAPAARALAQPPLTSAAQVAAGSLLVNLAVGLSAQPDAAALAAAVRAALPLLTDHEAYFRGLVALGTLLAEAPSKIHIQAQIVSDTKLHNRLKMDAISSPSEPILKKISIVSSQIIRLL